LTKLTISEGIIDYLLFVVYVVQMLMWLISGAMAKNSLHKMKKPKNSVFSPEFVWEVINMDSILKKVAIKIVLCGFL